MVVSARRVGACLAERRKFYSLENILKEEGSALPEVRMAGSVEDAALLRVQSDQQQKGQQLLHDPLVAVLAKNQHCSGSFPLSAIVAPGAIVVLVVGLFVSAWVLVGRQLQS
jgi:hypothetical protein